MTMQSFAFRIRIFTGLAAVRRIGKASRRGLFAGNRDPMVVGPRILPVKFHNFKAIDYMAIAARNGYSAQDTPARLELEKYCL